MRESLPLNGYYSNSSRDLCNAKLFPDPTKGSVLYTSCWFLPSKEFYHNVNRNFPLFKKLIKYIAPLPSATILEKVLEVIHKP